MKFRIYYSDGSILDGEGEPQDLPAYGVIAILHGRILEHGADWYVWREDTKWIPVKGDPSLILQFMHRAKSIRACLAGESVSNEIAQRIFDRAVKDQLQAQA